MPFPPSVKFVARLVVGGTISTETILRSFVSVLGRKSKVMERLTAALVESCGEGKRPRLEDVVDVLQSQRGFLKFCDTLFAHVETAELPPPQMLPAARGPSEWAVPAIVTPVDLADWLETDFDKLTWLSSPWRMDHEKFGMARNYRYRWIPRRGRVPRLIESPLPQLKSIQRKILRGILEKIPPHAAAHGFVQGRNITSFAEPHCAQRCVLRMDVQDFFPSIRKGRVLRVFLTAGYPQEVAELLANLCACVTPAAVRSQGGAMVPVNHAWSLQQKLRSRHLPQGAPTSPMLANLCFFAADSRLTGLARKFNATYSRYADDLLFSGGDAFRRDAARCEIQAAAILLEEGFALAHRKTQIMLGSVRQQAAGLVLNASPNLPRSERDQLKAILTNCLRHGPASQNRSNHADFRAHLLGRVSHAAWVNPASGAKLRGLFELIDWE